MNINNFATSVISDLHPEQITSVSMGKYIMDSMLLIIIAL